MLDATADNIALLNFILAGMAIAAFFCVILVVVLDGILMVVAHIAHLIRYLIGREQWLSGLPVNSAERRGVASSRQRQQPAEILHPAGSLRQAADEQPADNQQSADAHPAGCRQPGRLNDSGPPEGVAKGSPTRASGLPVNSLPVSGGGAPWRPQPSTAQSGKLLPVKWRPLETPCSVLPAPVIPEADAAMRFRIWILEFGLEEIGRGHGELIATVDLWELALRFAARSGFRIGSHNRFFEELRKLPGVSKEENRWVTRLRGGRQKRVAYSFRSATVAGTKAAGG